MEENKKGKKKLIVTIVFIVALTALVVGITYAIIIYTGNSSDNSISTGRISMSYTEPTNALIIENALPMSDEEGSSQNNYFEFTITSNASTNANDDQGVTIPYEININDITIDSEKELLPKSAIKMNLVKASEGIEEEVVIPTLISAFSSSSIASGATKIYETKNIHKNNNGSISTTYRLRTWIDKSFEIAGNKSYQYKFRVNVNSQVDALIVTDILAPEVKEIRLERYEETVAYNNNKDSIIRLANNTKLAGWVPVNNETVKAGDKIRIIVLYNEAIYGEPPSINLEFGNKQATGAISAGTIENETISYEYTVTANDNGKVSVKSLNGGNIKDAAGNNATLTIKEEIQEPSNNVISDNTVPSCGTISGASASWTGNDRTITVDCNDNESGCSKETFSKTFNTTTEVGYIEISDNAGNKTTCPVNVYVDKTEYNITINNVSGGTITADKTTAKVGESITVTATPNSGYKLDSLTYNDITIASGVAFSMPRGDVTITAKWSIAEYVVVSSSGGSYTGGWTCQYSGPGHSCSGTTTSVTSYCDGGQTTNASTVSAQKISFKGYKSIVITAGYTLYGNATCTFGFNTNQAWGLLYYGNNINGTTTIDISGFQDSYYLVLRSWGSTGSSSCYISELRLVP